MTENGSSRTSRRTLLLAAGSAGAAALAAGCSGQASTRGAAGRPQDPASPAPTGPSAPACVLTTKAGEGPYYLDLDRVRSDIAEGRAGVPFRLDLTVLRVSAGCRPVPGAAVDIWHADPSGTYSTGKDTFLRGTQLTDAAGRCTFRTIVPGWYRGLAPHIHFKVRPDRHTETTSQFFFPEELLVRVYALQPYARRKAPDHPNTRDGRYRDSGAAMTLAPVPDAAGHRAAYTVGIA
ncbi:intradiol ring-cleavage dioxygenase [Streptomyces sp. NBC_01264]|uniref:dioxygenase family protein n=1 Tax=Streptomyces sp. NBC_01264 TaxID=2903804 RepID=UPI00225512C5|nr:intradiol ring-cleavage dioxygenase [Streptomyces sp. NBC_01264]MCX4775639.1 intradiol ring-cleavage dioxygenase [Streptomyces sp. NBC_01264]